MNDASALIRHKREGKPLSAAQCQAVATGIASGQWSDAQVAALAMAVAWRDMREGECRDFTLALRDSGQCLDWSSLPGPVLDKHSTGGVGDAVSLALAPVVAACGGYVPMISGRGLGHTGGTLDKLESIMGYNVNPSPATLQSVLREAGCAIIGQSQDLVPADRRLYAVRDVTATVDVPALIVSSILSKKLAGGAQALVLDVKTGSGAQMPDTARTITLARRLLSVAGEAGLPVAVAVTDMNEVLGGTAGNALEVQGILDLLCGRPHCPRLRELVVVLSARLLQMGKLAESLEQAKQRVMAALDSGTAADRFARMVTGLGGPTDLLENPSRYLSQAPLQVPVLAEAEGFIQSINVRSLGDCVVQLGGGRQLPNAPIDHAVGLTQVKGLGDCIRRGEPLAMVYARTQSAAEQAAEQVRAAFCLGETAPAAAPLWRWLDQEEQ